MRAVRVVAPGGPEVLRQVELPLPEPGPGEVRVRLAAIGVNYADVMCRQARHPGMRPPPLVPGCEGAGVVEACGPGVLGRSVGERVGVYSPFGGAYAEALVVPEAYALPLPKAMPFDEAAALLHLSLTAQEALYGQRPLPARATLLVTAAAGGLGGTLTQLGQAGGMRVIAAVGSAAKRRLLQERGLDTVIDYGAGSLCEQVLAATGGRGVDIAVETVGGALFEQAQAALAPLGRIVIAGAAGGVAPRPDAAVLLARSATCRTLNLSVVFDEQPARSHEAWTALCLLYATGKLRPRIARRLPLAQAEEAHRLLEGRATVDKLLLIPQAGPDVHGMWLA